METKVTKYLDELNISYRLLPHKKPVYTCEDAAKERNVPLNEMIKCILLVDKGKKYILACCPADKRVDLDKIRATLNCKRLSFASEKEIEEITGHKIGAVPPLLIKENIIVIFDNSISEKENVNISSGDHLAGIELKTKDLLKIAKPIIADIIQK